MANTMSFEQVATVLNKVQSIATGREAISAVDTSTFTTCADVTLKTGYDPVMNALSQVLSKTIFSIRPYSAKFRGMEMDATAWGNHVRKIAICDSDIEEDDAYKYPQAYDSGQEPPDGNGETGADMYTIKKPEVIQTNFYGKYVYSDHYTVFDDQLNAAFSSPAELGSFLSLVTTNINDKLENYRENLCRALIANLIGSVIAEGQETRVIHLLTEYNALAGTTLTAQSVYESENFRAFMQFVYARVATLTDFFTERSTMFQTIYNNHKVMRHTPYADQRVYLYSPAKRRAECMAISNTFDSSYLKLADNETVNFWQSIEKPDTIQVTPGYTGTDGVPKKGTEVNKANVFGVVFDRDACGFNQYKNAMYATPHNARGEYTNFWIHVGFQTMQDMSEKAAVLLMD